MNFVYVFEEQREGGVEESLSRSSGQIWGCVGCRAGETRSSEARLNAGRREGLGGASPPRLWTWPLGKPAH